jgi:predicted nucleic acid-binding protein
LKRLVVDASALAAVAFREPAGEPLLATLQDAELFAPALLVFELASVAWKKVRRNPEQSAAILTNLQSALGDESGIIWQSVNPADVVMVAERLGCSTYDAAYVWLAGALGADLVTLDERLARLTAAATA